MSREERKLVAAIHKASGDLLAAKDYAATYMGRVALAAALADLYDYSAAALRRMEKTTA